MEYESIDSWQSKESFDGYPNYRIVKTIGLIESQEVRLEGRVEKDLHYDPVFEVESWSGLKEEILEYLHNGDISLPGVNLWFVQDGELGAVVRVEDWYELCVPYRGLNFSKGDPVSLKWIKGQCEKERNELREQTDLTPIYEAYQDHENAMWGQHQLFLMETYRFDATLDHGESGGELNE